MNPIEPSPSLDVIRACELLFQRNDAVAAALASRSILEQRPDDPFAIHVLGLALCQQETGVAEGIDLIERSIALAPGSAQFRQNLGAILGRCGHYDRAAVEFTAAVALCPDADGYAGLAIALEQLDDLEGAEAAAHHAVELGSQSAVACNALGSVLYHRGRLLASVEALSRSVKFAPNFVEAWNNLGQAYEAMGLLTDALRCFKNAVALRPSDARLHSNLCLALNYSDTIAPKEIFEAHLRYGARQVSRNKLRAGGLVRESSPSNKKESDTHLRIAYISADFRDHPRTRFLAPVVAKHDRDAVTVYCYSDVRRPDKCTQRFQAIADEWRNIAGLSDERVTAMIRADQISVLIDMTGHMSDNRLGVFARRAAPVQMLYPGYPGTTGLTAVDYCLTDSHRDPPGSEAFYTERLLRLPGGSQCYDPSDVGEAPPPIGPPPVERNKVITFGCFNRLVKITPTVVDLWSAVMRKVLGSRLMLLSGGVASDHARLSDVFAQQGISRDRIIFIASRPRQQYLELYNKIDIVLDTFPYHGHTTTLDALWMGVPTVSLMGQTRPARESRAILSAVALDDLATNNLSEFVDVSIKLAADQHRLSTLRNTLRDKMRHGPLMDFRRVAREIEDACRWAMANRSS